VPQDATLAKEDSQSFQFDFQESYYEWEPQAEDLDAMLEAQLRVEVDGVNDEYINQRGITICDYKALRSNELSFPEGAIIEHIVSSPFIICIVLCIPFSYYRWMYQSVWSWKTPILA